MIVLVTGLKGSGKDTVGDWLAHQYKFNKMSFADPLKDVVSVMFNWDREKLDGNSVQDRVWRETKDEKWSKILGKPITPRLMLQEIGTDLVRKNFDDDFWVKSAKSKIERGTNYVFTDTRFPNEINLFKKQFDNTIVIDVIRPPLPFWYNDIQLAIENNIHPSEYSLVNSKHLIDYTIINDKDISELCSWVDTILEG